MASGNVLCVFTALNNEPPASAYATLDTRNSIAVLDFDGATDEEAFFRGVLPDNYAGGGLTVDLYSMATSATSGTYRYQVAIEREDLATDHDSNSLATDQSAGASTAGTSGVATKVSVTFTSGANMDSLAAGEPFRLRVHRDADGTSGTDDITTDIELMTVVVKET